MTTRYPPNHSISPLQCLTSTGTDRAMCGRVSRSSRALSPTRCATSRSLLYSTCSTTSSLEPSLRTLVDWESFSTWCSTSTTSRARTCAGSLASMPSYQLTGALQSSIPNSISSCTSLKSIEITYTRLNGTVPSSLSKLTNLEMLLLNHNNVPATHDPEPYPAPASLTWCLSSSLAPYRKASVPSRSCGTSRCRTTNCARPYRHSCSCLLEPT